jgi:hypothetical protein
MDSIVDGLGNGRMIRILSVVDAFTRECLVLEVDTSLGSGRVTRELDRLIATTVVELWSEPMPASVSSAGCWLLFRLLLDDRKKLLMKHALIIHTVRDLPTP